MSKSDRLQVGEWEDYIIVPVQCRLPILFRGVRYMVYLRGFRDGDLQGYVVRLGQNDVAVSMSEDLFKANNLRYGLDNISKAKTALLAIAVEWLLKNAKNADK